MSNEENVNEKKEKKGVSKLLSRILKTTKSKIIFTVLIIVIVLILGLVLRAKFFNSASSLVDVAYLNMLLENSSELTTAKMKITGLGNYKDTGVMIINRSDFKMVYTATVRAGVELKDVKIEKSMTNPKEIVVTMPKAKVFDCHVDPKDIQYFDEKFALFNVNSKEDANRAVALAEEDGIKETEETGILEFAETEAEYVIKNILTPAIPDNCTITVKRVNE